MNKKRVVTILAAMIPLVATLVGFTGFTFSWFVLQAKNTSVKVGVSSGSLSVSNLNLTCYKAFFPDFEGEYVTPDTFINSDGAPKVYASTDTPKPDRGFEMNLLDPTYITISDDIGFYDLYTALVYKISFDVTYSSKINMDVKIKRNVYNADRLADTLYVSDYVHYFALTDADSKAISAVDSFTETFDGGVESIRLTYTPRSITSFKINGSDVNPTDYTIDGDTIRFNSAVQAGEDIISIAYTSYNYLWEAAKDTSIDLQETTFAASGDGTTTTFQLPKMPVSVESVKIDGALSRGHIVSGRNVTFLTAPEEGAAISIEYTYSKNQDQDWIKTFPNTSVESLSLFGEPKTPLVDTDPAQETTGSFETYVVVDYDPSLCGYNDSSLFFLTGNLGKDYTLYDDYEFELEVSQA